MINQEHYYIVTHNDGENKKTKIKHTPTGIEFSISGGATESTKRQLVAMLEEELNSTQDGSGFL